MLYFAWIGSPTQSRPCIKFLSKCPTSPVIRMKVLLTVATTYAKSLYRATNATIDASLTTICGFVSENEEEMYHT